jgi:hypothetical protein
VSSFYDLVNPYRLVASLLARIKLNCGGKIEIAQFFFHDDEL